MSIQEVQGLRLYRNFKAIAPDDYHEIVRYYERHKDIICDLDDFEFFDCAYSYGIALYETTDYDRFLVMVDHLIEYVIMRGVNRWRGEDVFQLLLFKKASALYRIGRSEPCDHVLRELLRINPAHKGAVSLLEMNSQEQKPRWLRISRACAVGASLLAAILIAVEIFAIKPFWPEAYPVAEVAHNILLFGGIAWLSVAELWHYAAVRFHIRRFVNFEKSKKRC
ncbi:MAG: hypothetical protein ACK4NS_08750 [Saprospiraceae bacterium]